MICPIQTIQTTQTIPSIQILYEKQVRLLGTRSNMFVKNYCENHREIFIDVFTNDNIEYNNGTDSHTLCIQGLYLAYVKKDYEGAKTRWHLSIRKNNVYSMYCLGNYYQRIKVNHVLMKTYYLLAIEKNDIYSMEHLGRHYYNNRTYEMALHFWIMALEHKSDDRICKGTVMAHLGTYYCHIETDYVKAKHYWEMAVEMNDVFAMHNLGIYYYNIEQNFDQAMYYYTMAIKEKSIVSLDPLIHLIRKQNINVYEKLFDILKHVVTDDSFNIVKLFKKYTFDSFILWKILNKLEQTIVLSSSVVQFKNSLQTDVSNKFMYCLKCADENKLYGICPLCLDSNVLIIKMGCEHGVCYDCCDPSRKCFFQWCEK